MRDRDDALRAMAMHRGLKLVKSRRRKPGGDFGLYGLRDAAGVPTFGFDGDALTASDAEIEAHLRSLERETWGRSAGASGRPRKARPVPPPSPPPPSPRRPKIAVANLFDALPTAGPAEAFTELLARPGVRLERIVSHGQSTPKDAPMVQAQDEWVVVLQGSAGLRIEDSEEIALAPGDHVLIAAGCRHWVTWTARGRATVWLALHLG